MALIIATELLISLSYKLRMFGIHIGGSSDTFCDNLSVMENVYPDDEEMLPPNMPKSRGLSINNKTYVDTDHSDKLSTYRSHANRLIYLNNLLIICSSKRQNRV